MIRPGDRFARNRIHPLRTGRHDPPGSARRGPPALPRPGPPGVPDRCRGPAEGGKPARVRL